MSKVIKVSDIVYSEKGLKMVEYAENYIINAVKFQL